MVMYENEKQTHINIYDFDKVIGGHNNESALYKQIVIPKENIITQVSWGPLNKSLYLATNKGRIILLDIETETNIAQADIHKSEII
jgi:hypothetical protein